MQRFTLITLTQYGLEIYSHLDKAFIDEEHRDEESALLALPPVIKGQTVSLLNFFLLDEKPRMKSDGKDHLRQQENCILRGEKSKFCGTIELYDASSKSRLCRVT